MKWKKRAAEIEKLRQKHGRDRSKVRSFPDLSVEQRPKVAPLSNRFGPPALISREVLQAILGPGFTVSHLHKSGYQVLSVKDAPYFGKKT
jgi:hypothetical protein